MRSRANSVGPGFTHLQMGHPLLRAFSTAFTAPGYDHTQAEAQFAAAHAALKTGALHDLADPGFATKPWGMSDDEYEDHRVQHHQKVKQFHDDVRTELGKPELGDWDARHAWAGGMRHALTMGHVDLPTAKERGYQGDDREMGREGKGGWQKLPPKVLHVGTDADAIAREGLKTRAEQGGRVTGLGGGGSHDQDQVSVTTDQSLGPDIYHSLHEHHAAIHGKITPGQLLDYAKKPPVGEPFEHNLRLAVPHDLIHRATHGVQTHEGLTAPERSEWNDADPGDWHVTKRHDAVPALADLYPKGAPAKWERPSTERELHQDRSEFYKAFSGVRHRSGGHRDPLYLGNDAHAFAQTDPSKFGILHLKPHEGAQGYPLTGTSSHHSGADSGEWRTASGSPFDVDKIERPTPRHLGEFGISKQAVQQPPEGLNFTHDEFETGEGKYPTQVHLRAHTPEDGQVGALIYNPPRRRNGIVRVRNLHVEQDQRRRGIGSALMDEMQRRHPDSTIDHGDRTYNGEDWWKGYTDGKKVRRGRTAALDLYHRTTPEAAEAIHRDRRMTSKENTQEAYFSTHRDGEAGTGYGEGVVHVRVPEHLAELDDEFPDGEQHYRVKVRDLQPNHFVHEAGIQMVQPSRVWDHIRPDVHEHRLDTIRDSVDAHGYQPSWDHVDGPIKVDLSGETPRVGNGSHRLHVLRERGMDDPIPMQVSASLSGIVKSSDKQGVPGGEVWNCRCGLPIEWDESDGWQHIDGSISHDGEFHGKSVSDLVGTTPPKTAAAEVHRLPVHEFQDRYSPAEYDAHGEGWGVVGEHPSFMKKNPFNPERVHRGTWDAFVDHVRQHGIQEPVEVDPVNEEVVAGHHRVKAAEEAGRDVPFVFSSARKTAAADWSHLTYWHGTPSGDLRGARNGLHIGSQEAARQALHARIGFRADGKDWDGTQEYGKTLLAGRSNLMQRDSRGYLLTGHNTRGLPEHDHYAHERPDMPGFGNTRDGERVQPHHKPDLFPVKIIGPMSNTPSTPHEDFKANGYMQAQITKGNAKRGYFYTNQGEDSGSVSAVVPNGDHVQRADQRTGARVLPHERVFGPTFGLDRRLWIGDSLHPEVRDDIVQRFRDFCLAHGYLDWSTWVKIVFFGSEASEWTSETLEGNGDFDLSIGIEYNRFRETNPTYSSMDDTEISSMFTRQMYVELNDPQHTFPDIDGVYDNTWFCNQLGWDITQIKPYAAWDVLQDYWIVRPPHLPHWSWDGMPKPIQRVLKGSIAYARSVLALPEPQRTLTGAALYREWHEERSSGFGEKGQGWWSISNLREKALDQLGLWARLYQCKVRDEQDTDTNPNGWDNSHPFGLALASRSGEMGQDATRLVGMARVSVVVPESDQHIAGLPKTQKCKYCSNQATQRVIHSEGMAYVPTCDQHLDEAKDDAARCTPDGSVDPTNIDAVRKIAAEQTYMPLDQFRQLVSPQHRVPVSGLRNEMREEYARRQPGERHFGEESHGGSDAYLDHLRSQIANEGLREPIEVGYPSAEGERRYGPGPHLTDGNHRGVAVHELGVDPVPVKWTNQREARKITAEDYRYQHRPSGPPRPDDYYEGGQPAHDLDQGRSGSSRYDSSPSRRVRSLFDHPDTKVIRALIQARGNPEHPVTMYRAVPHEHADAGFRTGDWVTLSKAYAQSHARGNGGMPVIKATVPAKHLWTDGDYNEWGYHGEPTQGEIHTPGRKQASTDRWPPYLTEREDAYGDKYPANVSRKNVRGPVATESEAQEAGLSGPYYHGTNRRRAREIRSGGFRQPRLHNNEMADTGMAEEVDFGHTHRTFFADTHDEAMHFARSHHGDDADVVKAYIHPDHVEHDSGGGWMPSVQCRDAAKITAIRPEGKTASTTIPYIRNNSGMRHVPGFGQEHEPWGRYMSPDSGHAPEGWERGQVDFDNPLHVDHDDGAWKQRLSEEHGGATGKDLSRALMDKGHDAVITHDKYGIGEVVDIRPKGQRTHRPSLTVSAQG